MGIISGLIGNAAETDIEAVKKEYGKLLGRSEAVGLSRILKKPALVAGFFDMSMGDCLFPSACAAGISGL